MRTPPRSVDEYMAALPPDARVALEKLRTMIKAAAPAATETISYQMPAFKHNGRHLVAFAAFKHHCSLFVMSTAVADALSDELRAYDTAKGTVRFAAGKPLPVALVKKIVRARIAENEARLKK